MYKYIDQDLKKELINSSRIIICNKQNNNFIELAKDNYGVGSLFARYTYIEINFLHKDNIISIEVADSQTRDEIIQYIISELQPNVNSRGDILNSEKFSICGFDVNPLLFEKNGHHNGRNLVFKII